MIEPGDLTIPRVAAPPAAPPRGTLLDAGFLAALGVIGLVGFGPVFSGLTYLIAGVTGLLLGLLVALAAVRLRLGVLVTVAAGLVVFLLAAGPAALRETTSGGVVPTSATVRALVDGSVHGWRDLLTTLPPAPASGICSSSRTCGFVCGLVGLLLAGRTRFPTLPLLAPGALLIAAILFGTDEPASLLVQGVGFAAVAFAWAALRQRRRRPAATTVAGVPGGRRRLAGAAALIVLAAGGASRPRCPRTTRTATCCASTSSRRWTSASTPARSRACAATRWWTRTRSCSASPACPAGRGCVWP
ncbi:hypothetical protein ACFQX7_26450 [Luedemannella flava]